VSIANKCNVHVFYKIIFSNIFNLIWTRTHFLRIFQGNNFTNLQAKVFSRFTSESSFIALTKDRLKLEEKRLPEIVNRAVRQSYKDSYMCN